ncbi:MAG: hypothetical protein F6K55_42465 [Moorea sp. SIO4A3]|nr:hypothetical protein [Moorena sp. SIO4A3]
MSLYRRVEPILVELRPMFAGFATFEWFVLLLWGVILYTLFVRVRLVLSHTLLIKRVGYDSGNSRGNPKVITVHTDGGANPTPCGDR